MAATTRPDPGSDALARTAPVVITPMRRRHLRQVLRIDQQVYPRPWSLGLYLGELSTTDGRSYLVARRGTEVVGYAGLMVIAGDAHVTTVAVAPVHQHQGLATRLLLVLAREAVALGAERVTLEVRASNLHAQRLYSRFGFAPAGIRKAYYVDNREDAVIMWAIDVGAAPYAERLAGIEAALPTPTVLQGVRSGDDTRAPRVGEDA
ncbi:MAG TPA: ribosomal protein S18-alanine N-acetyltransferase [Iamia sp.]|jgi:ribosomal-protein-alanine N-acetyltransferase|nr:ribosomal protein S18-alanine N-acetyltransferase [Iamia sp.]